MVIYLKSINLDLWNVIVNGYTHSKKHYKKWNENERNLTTLDVKGLNALFCVINKDQFNRICNCSTSHETWHVLEVTREGTS